MTVDCVLLSLISWPIEGWGITDSRCYLVCCCFLKEATMCFSEIHAAYYHMLVQKCLPCLIMYIYAIFQQNTNIVQLYLVSSFPYIIEQTWRQVTKQNVILKGEILKLLKGEIVKGNIERRNKTKSLKKFSNMDSLHKDLCVKLWHIWTQII